MRKEAKLHTLWSDTYIVLKNFYEDTSHIRLEPLDHLNSRMLETSTLQRALRSVGKIKTGLEHDLASFKNIIDLLDTSWSNKAILENRIANRLFENLQRIRQKADTMAELADALSSLGNMYRQKKMPTIEYRIPNPGPPALFCKITPDIGNDQVNLSASLPSNKEFQFTFAITEGLFPRLGGLLHVLSSWLKKRRNFNARLFSVGEEEPDTETLKQMIRDHREVEKEHLRKMIESIAEVDPEIRKEIQKLHDLAYANV